MIILDYPVIKINLFLFIVLFDVIAPSEVRGLSFPKIQFNSVEVSWKAPERPNGNIGYYLSYWEFSGDFSRATTLVLPGKPPSKLVPYLKPFTNYTFSVQPYNLRKNLTGPSTKRNVRTKATRKNCPCLFVWTNCPCVFVCLTGVISNCESAFFNIARTLLVLSSDIVPVVILI